MSKTIEQSLATLVQGGGQRDAVREQALTRFLALGLPAYRSEDYQRTDLPSLFVGIDAVTPQGYVSQNSEALPSGVQLESVEASQAGLPAMNSTERDALAQLATALSADVQRLRIAGAVSDPIALRLERGAGTGASISASRLVIELEAGAEASIVVEDAGTNLSLQAIEIYLGQGARLNYTEVEDSPETSKRISTLHIHQEHDSYANIHFFTLRSGVTRNNYHCDLRGEGAHLSLGGAVVATGEAHVDNYSYIAHSLPHCTSSELFKYILADRSYGVFTGRILVAIDAQKTQAYQNNRNLLLSPTARMQAKPQLEIYADDVKCSHGMTTGQLSEEALFYMRQRGISYAEARRLLTIAFVGDVLERLEDESLRASLADRVAARF